MTENNSKGARDTGIDMARGLAVLLMIQTHAYDAWVEVGARSSVAYRITRELGAIPAPIFVFLAGLGVAFGEAAMLKKGTVASAVRSRFVRRGLEILVMGYVVSAIYAWMDGAGLREILRADILHAIALSLVTLALVVVARKHATVFAWGLVVVALASSIALTAVARTSLSGMVFSPFVALFLEVPPYTRFPLLPLLAFASMGYLAGRRLLVQRLAPSRAWMLCVLSVVIAVIANFATKAWVDAAGLGPLSRAHPALLANFVDGVARASAVTCFAIAVADHVPSRFARELVRLGQGSLFAYAFHIPFCYGRLGRGLARSLDMSLATLAVLALMVLTWLAVWVRDLVEAKIKAMRAT